MRPGTQTLVTIFVRTATMTMKKICSFLFLIMGSASLKAQETLPGITVVNVGGKIIVSWKNAYKNPPTTINIQRSYDSLKNYTTIGSVLTPQNAENGYADANAPYNKMYYRVFVAFEGGSYLLTDPVRPTKDTSTRSSSARYPWQLDPNNDPRLQVPPEGSNLNFPSKWVFTARDNNVIIHLPQASIKKYTAVFHDETGKNIFELTNLKEEYLIIEKVNFVRAGWYSFELFDDGTLVEKNKFFIPKDGKVTNEPMKKAGNR